MKTEAVAEQLCLKCGLCCNGVLFKDVELQKGDDPARLEAFGLKLRRTRSRTGASLVGLASCSTSANIRLLQPCAALGAGNRCGCYQERPLRCRQFECALFKAVAAERTELASAVQMVRRTQKLADKVRRLLRCLGDSDEHLPLSRRFNRTRRRIESSSMTAETAEVFGDLTIAMHALNVVLSGRFYPGS